MNLKFENSHVNETKRQLKWQKKGLNCYLELS